MSDAAFEDLLAEWTHIARHEVAVATWEGLLADFQREVNELKSAGRWKSGSRTLLHTLGLHHDEVRLCAGLAWLLRPDGWHELGSSVLDALLAELGLHAESAVTAEVVTEETHEDTRADIVIRAWPNTVLIEAKVFADEQPNQADRLARLWGDESPTLVYLTRTGVLPRTAQESAGAWKPLTWRRVADMIADAIRDRPSASAGAREYLESLELFGG